MIKFDIIGLDNLNELNELQTQKKNYDGNKLGEKECLQVAEIIKKLYKKTGGLQLRSTTKGGDNNHQFVLIQDKTELILDSYYGNDQVAFEMFSKINDIFNKK
jgi:hypothetical protein